MQKITDDGIFIVRILHRRMDVVSHFDGADC